MVERRLPDGTKITVRPIRKDDAPKLRAAFERLSPESRYRRFLGGLKELNDETVRYLTEVDGENHVALVATRESLDLKDEEGLGVARFVRVAGEPDAAEAAVTVLDEYQRRGIGHVLLEELVDVARAHGITKFRGEALPSNEPIMTLLREAGADMHTTPEGTCAFYVSIVSPVVTAAVPPAAARVEHRLPASLVHLFRAFAGQLAESLRVRHLLVHAEHEREQDPAAPSST